jgi:hypothetical protein
VDGCALYSEVLRVVSQPETVSAGATPADDGTLATMPSRERRAIGVSRLVLQAGGVWLASRIAFTIFTYFEASFFKPGAHPPVALLASWKQWDADWYLIIARHGYLNAESTAFFPLFPGLTRMVSPLFGGHLLPAAILVANLGGLAALIGIALLAAHERWTAESAWGAMALAISYPFAFYMIVPYAEGVLFGLIALTLYFARRGRWELAAVGGFLGALSRPTGIVLFLPILWEVGRQHGWWRSVARRRWAVQMSRRSLLAGSAAVLAVPVGLGAYMAFLWMRFGDPLLFIHAQERYWGRQPMSLPDVGTLLFKNLWQTPPWSAAQALELSALIPTLIFLLATIALIRRVPVSYTLLMAGLLFLALDAPVLASTEKIESVGRELAVAVPTFVALGGVLMRRPAWQMLLVATGFLVQAVFAQIFLASGWIA